MNPVHPVTNFGRVTFAAGFNNAATSLTLATGDGAKLPATSLGSFYLTVWDSFYVSPHLDPNRERILVTTRSTDTLSVVVRGQDGTSAQNHNTAGRTYIADLTFGMAEYYEIWNHIASDFNGVIAATEGYKDIDVPGATINAKVLALFWGVNPSPNQDVIGPTGQLSIESITAITGGARFRVKSSLTDDQNSWNFTLVIGKY